MTEPIEYTNRHKIEPGAVPPRVRITIEPLDNSAHNIPRVVVLESTAFLMASYDGPHLDDVDDGAAVRLQHLRHGTVHELELMTVAIANKLSRERLRMLHTILGEFLAHPH